MKQFLIITLYLSACLAAMAQRQYSDSSYAPPPFEAMFQNGSHPLVAIDEAHHNFHTREGRYAPFASVLEMDGFRVISHGEPFRKRHLKEPDILVISNALPASSLEKWEAPTAPAFTEKEIRHLEKWVRKGGRLLLMADHMPMGGAAADLAAAFGLTFYDSFADNQLTLGRAELFKKADGSLASNHLTLGSETRFEVDSVMSFTGQAFQIPPHATSILNCREGWISFLPQVAWQFDEDTPRLDSEGWSQGAFLEHGEGKVVAFGEAAMFSAQIAELQDRTILAGMNHPMAKNNYRLLLNAMRWLAR